MSNQPNHAEGIYTPHETALAGYEAAQRAREAAALGVDLAIAGTDLGQYFARLMPWEICAVQAQTSNGKSLFMDWWETQLAHQLVAEKRDEAIVHFSTEETLEAMAFYQYAKILNVPTGDIASGKVEDSRMQFAMTKIDGVPVYRIADSAGRPEGAPELNLSNAYRAMQALQRGDVTGRPVKIACVFVDYLQALPLEKSTRMEDQRRLQVRRDVYRLRDMTTHLQAPIVVGVQAKQKLDGANPPYMIPGMYDGEETSSIAQRFDRVISLWLPKTTYRIGQEVEDYGTVEEDSMWLKVVKQRGGFAAGASYHLRVDYQRRDFSLKR